jgi:hypothetical protein
MSIYIDNTPKKEYYVKTFNEPKNINHLVKRSSNVSTDKEYVFYNDLEDYLVGSSFDESDNKVTVPGKLHADLDKHAYFVLLDDKNIEKATKIQVSTNTEIIYEKSVVDSDDDSDEDDDKNNSPFPPIINFTMTPATQFYVGSLSVLGLLIFFRMLYRR